MLGKRIAIVLGANSITVFSHGKGIVFSESSTVISDRYSGRTLVMGGSAKSMSERLPASMQAVTPIRNGIVNDYDAAVVMIRKYINKLCAGRLLKPNGLLSVPSTVTSVQQKTIFDIVSSAGAARACFVDEALAAAIGAGVSLTQPMGTFICDIGGETTDCAVVTMGNIAVSRAVNVGGNDLDRTISDYIYREHNIQIGSETADMIKRTVGTAVFRNEEVAVIAGGKNCDTGLPVHFEITSTEVYWVLKSFLEEILDCIKRVLQNTPPELVSDIAETGIILSGGTANLYGIDRFIEWNTHIHTHVAENPEHCAALGLGKLLNNIDYLEANGYVFVSAEEPEDD